ncbi:MAG: hypothetical protein A2W98_01140 [Bacteroidetes bacterium GWF2_33_38]|nr:MAG: hypothetical protein A2W98_01140 [Bacteroidetes bacterium GWF2_33_38]OFY72787.1 MAG: hypothetical protein A2265_05820 [Bacteroidetes bacterium RIFOXYA12_FULL_33_9]OFY91562.1 MAG: hypothetical protein A2236_10635 [Bacteroidetes bacterium RIFOXYA2_FULL_33_7]HBX50601.1 hypothetical protein [Bacteroidales bacterium]
MKKIIKIGGEFDINPNILEGYPDYTPNNNTYLYSSGRSALMAILKQVSTYGKSIIHIPYYICPSVVFACEKAGFDVKFYELDKNYLFPLEYLTNIRINDVVLTVNYFGFVDDNPTILEIRNLRPDITIISDQVQSFWTYDKTEADFSFTSLRKHFPIPDGALIYSKNQPIELKFSLKESFFYKNKLIGSLLKNQSLPDNIYLKFFEDAELELDIEKEPLKASKLSHFLYEKIDFEKIRTKRNENYKYTYEIGLQFGLNFMFSYNDSVTPLNVPILLNNRDHVRKKIMNNNIFLPIHWTQSNYNICSDTAKRIGINELSLVIDQRYSKEEIYYQIEIISKMI